MRAAPQLRFHPCQPSASRLIAGTTTATVLTRAILAEGCKSVAAGAYNAHRTCYCLRQGERGKAWQGGVELGWDVQDRLMLLPTPCEPSLRPQPLRL